MTPLKQAIEDSDLNAAQLAVRIGKHETQVSKWANGASAPRLEVALAIARELGTSVDLLWPETERAAA